jgi:hypothetical protein
MMLSLLPETYSLSNLLHVTPPQRIAYDEIVKMLESRAADMHNNPYSKSEQY